MYNIRVKPNWPHCITDFPHTIYTLYYKLFNMDSFLNGDNLLCISQNILVKNSNIHTATCSSCAYRSTCKRYTVSPTKIYSELREHYNFDSSY